MFINTNLLYILGPAIVLWLGISLFVRFRARSEADPIQRAWTELRLSMYGVCAFLILLWFLLPSTPVLSTFGYPHDVEVVKDPTRLLGVLRDYNRALVRTTEVVYWLLFVLVWCLSTSVLSFAKALTFARSVPGVPRVD